MREGKSQTFWILMYEGGFEWHLNPTYPCGWKSYPMLYCSRAEAIREAAEDQIEIWRQVGNGERDIEAVWEVPELIEVEVFEDGYMASEGFEYTPEDFRKICRRDGREY